MREDGFAGGGTQVGADAGVDPGDDFVRRDTAIGKCGDHLPLALSAMSDVLVNQPLWIFNNGAVGRQQARRTQVAHAPQRLEVLAQIPAAGRRDHHGAAQTRQITAINLARRGVDETKMIRRMPRRRHRDQRTPRPAQVESLAIPERLTRTAADDDAGPPLLQRRHASDMIDVTMRDQDEIQRRATKLTLDRRNVRWFADARLDQNRGGPGKQVCVISGRTGPFRGIAGPEQDHSEIVLETQVGKIAVAEAADAVAAVTTKPAE